MNTPVKFIYFDVGGVMVKGASSKQLAEKSLGVSIETFNKVYEKYSTLSFKGKITPNELVGIYRKELEGVKINPLSFWNDWLESLLPMEEIHTLIHQLVNKYKLGILTNSHKGLLGQIRSKNLIPDIDYAYIIESSEVGFAKPEKEIYNLAQKMTGFSARNIYFIDNRKENISAAKKLGWKGFVFDQENPNKSVEKLRRILL